MPRQVSFPAGTGAIVDVSAGRDYVLAVDDNGAVFGWGQGMQFSNVLCTCSSVLERPQYMQFSNVLCKCSP